MARKTSSKTRFNDMLSNVVDFSGPHTITVRVTGYVNVDGYEVMGRTPEFKALVQGALESRCALPLLDYILENEECKIGQMLVM